MRRPVLVLALASALPIASAIGGNAYPGDEVIVRSECFTGMELEGAILNQLGYAPGGAASGAAAPASPSPSRGVTIATGKGGRGGLKAPKSKPKKTSSAAAGNTLDFAAAPEEVAEPMPMPEAEPADDAYDMDELGGDMGDYDGEFAKQAEEEKRERTDGKARDSRKPDTTARRVLDWGAKIFLSNDDSMSLASAQRVIYALQRHTSLPMEHIRPHELLNYFSFDVAEPTEAQLFDVHASATQNGEQLSVAFAVKGATPERQPLDLTMVLDRSCSMDDEGRMEYTKRGLHQMREQLRNGDRVDIVLFDDAVCTPLENFVVGRDDERLLIDTIEQIRPEGATDLDLGLKEGYRIAKNHRDTHRRNRRVMVLTDAELNTGDVNPHTVSEIGKAFDSDGIRLTGVGVGRTFRDDVLDRLTEKGKGAYVFLGSEAVVDRLFGAGFESLVQTIAHDVQFELDLPDSLAMERFYGEEASTVAADIQPINYYAGTSQVFLQDLALKGGRPVKGDTVTLTVRYRDAKTGEPEKRVFRTSVGAMLASDTHNVDKARTLMAWTDLLQAQAMGADPCGAPLETYASRATRLPQDAEIAFVNDLVIGICGELPLPTTVAAAPLKVRVDSDQPISHVALSCPGIDEKESLSGSDTIAKFDAAPGMCTVTLGGVVDLRVDVEVPETGRDLRCTVRGGRVHCG